MIGFIAGAISGLIACPVFQWNKVLHGWQYPFIIEGSLTVGVGLLLFLILSHSVQKLRWFTEEEKALARQRLEEDSQDIDKSFRWDDAQKECKDWTTWAFTLMAILYGVGVTSSSNFLPVSPKVAVYTRFDLTHPRRL